MSKRILLSASVCVLAAATVYSQTGDKGSKPKPTVVEGNKSKPTPAPSPAPAPTPSPAPMPTPVPLPSTGGLKAFPTAEGFGAMAKGGRGGKVHHVTTLADSGAGSLRACAEATGPRTCIFRVAGTIELDEEIVVLNPYLTIAGQSAPGGGIQIKNRNSLGMPFWIQTSEVVIRHVRVRPGPSPRTTDRVNCFTIGNERLAIRNIILANVSCSWSTDQLIATLASDVGNVTVQDSLFYEGLNHSTHTRPHSKGPNFRGCTAGVSFIRSLVSSNTDRNVNFTCSGQLNMINNVIYNVGSDLTTIYMKRGNSVGNFIGNSFIVGPSTARNNLLPFGINAPDHNSNVPGASVLLYLEGNIGEGLPSNAAFGVLNPRNANLVAGSRLGLVTEQILPAMSAYNLVLGRSGAFPRDSQDLRAISNVLNRTGRIIDHPSEVGGWPTLAGGTPYPDADSDGMDDRWEAAQGVGDPNGDKDGDGYTNLEEFLNGLAV
jgi:hypothetical protein